jgi:lysozyme
MNFTPGIDVSHYQGTIDWPRVKLAGIQFAFLKATDGTTGRDPMFAQNAEGCNLAGIPYGAYHFWRPDDLAEDQAANFLSLANLKAGQLPPVLDLETEPVEAEEIIFWLEKVTEDSPTGMKPIIYGSSSFAFEWLDDAALHAYPLWVAHYTTNLDPGTAGWDDWEFWQHTPQGQVDGISTPVDLDWFHGTPEDLRVRFLSSV